MMRSCSVALAAASASGSGEGSSTAKQLMEMPKDLSDWTRLGDLMKNLTVGKCTDTTVLDKSIIPTRHFQRSLFRLPVPKLEKTCERYLNAVKPIVPPKQFEKTEKLTKAFAEGDGQSLQDELVRTDKANKHTSYISADWFDLYLSDRQPLPINYNACLLTRRDPDKPDMLTRAAFWITSSVQFYKLYLNNTLKPEVFYFGNRSHYSRQEWFQRSIALLPEVMSAKAMAIGSNFHAFPLDMSQNDNLFNSARIPGVLKDEVKGYGFMGHIIVQHRGHQYVVNVADADCNPVSEEQIYARLKAIVDLNAAPAKTDVGIFTTMNRTAWNGVRVSMLRHMENQKNFELVDSAMFVLNLDDDVSVDFLTGKGSIAANRNFLVRDSNRWWDKSFSVTVAKDGFIGISFEHSWGDGVAVLRYAEDIFNDSTKRSAKSMSKKAAPTESVRQLGWKLTPEIENAAVEAKKRLSKEIQRMDFYSNVVNGIGKKTPIFKKGVVKADPFMQVAMQLAWWRLNKSTVSTYESASTAAYLRGRTECIRSATIESQKFTLLMDKPNTSGDEKVEALHNAVVKQNQLAKEAKMGDGIDRHLFELKKIAERRNANVIPEFFDDPSYATLGSNILSTSSLYSDSLIGGGFGPVSPGYGIGYAAGDECLIFNVSCWKENGPNYNAEEFAAAVHQAAVDMHNVLLTNPRPVK